MDVQMPEMDGLEATQRIRRQWPDPEKPWIVAMTANAMQGDREMCLSAGMNDYVTKPIRLESVVACLKSSWGSLQSEAIEVPADISADDSESTGEPVSPEKGPDAGDDILDLAALRRLEELAGGDTAFLIEFIDTFLDGAPKMVAEIRNSVEGGDASTLRRVAHTLKSNSAALGASQLSALCKELEDLGKNETLDDAPGKVELVELEFEPITTALGKMRQEYESR